MVSYLTRNYLFDRVCKDVLRLGKRTHTSARAQPCHELWGMRLWRPPQLRGRVGESELVGWGSGALP